MIFIQSAKTGWERSRSVLHMKVKSYTKTLNKWTGGIEEVRNAYKILVGKSEGERPVGRTRLKWEDSIRMDLREIGWEVVDWIHLAQDRDRLRALVSTVMNLRVL